MRQALVADVCREVEIGNGHRVVQEAVAGFRDDVAFCLWRENSDGRQNVAGDFHGVLGKAALLGNRLKGQRVRTF